MRRGKAVLSSDWLINVDAAVVVELAWYMTGLIEVSMQDRAVGVLLRRKGCPCCSRSPV